MTALDQPPAIVCSIAREQADDRVRIRGRLVAREETKGSYSLRIERSGPSGSSTVNQGGPFTAVAETETFVGLASFNAEPGATFVADFTLRVGEHTYRCDAGDGGLR